MKVLTLERQTRILLECAAEGVSVTEALEAKGFGFDSLRYSRAQELPALATEYIPFDDIEARRMTVPAVSFFTGAGGIDLGLAKAGFRSLAAFEYEGLFCQTLRKNHLAMSVFGPPNHEGDLKNRQQVIHNLESIGIKPNFDGIFHGGPPCQPFSIAANQSFKRTGFSSEKGSLLMDFVHVALHFRPRCLLIENVPGLMDIDGGVQLREVYRELEKAGYSVAEPLILNARNYGVPQDRKRLFVVAWRGTSCGVSVPAHLGLASVSQAFERPLYHLPGHLTRDHKAESLLRYMVLDYGQRDKLGRIDRLFPNKPSKTVIAGGLHGGGKSHLHPEIPRTLSPRECARLQTFPDDYEFAGSAARQFTQIGNAVPPKLAYVIGQAIMEGVFESRVLF